MDSQKFGAFVAEIRKERGLTQSELAKKLSVTNKAVSRWETGAGFPDINTLEPLAEALGVSVMELIRSERKPEGGLTDEDAEKALSDTIELANLRRDRREFIIAAVALCFIALLLIGLAVFMPSAPTVWSLPFIFCTVSGLGCLFYARKKRRRGLPSALWFTAAGVLLFVPLAQIILLVILVVSGPLMCCLTVPK